MKYYSEIVVDAWNLLKKIVLSKFIHHLIVDHGSSIIEDNEVKYDYSLFDHIEI